MWRTVKQTLILKLNLIIILKRGFHHISEIIDALSSLRRSQIVLTCVNLHPVEIGACKDWMMNELEVGRFFLVRQTVVKGGRGFFKCLPA